MDGWMDRMGDGWMDGSNKFSNFAQKKFKSSAGAMNEQKFGKSAKNFFF